MTYRLALALSLVLAVAAPAATIAQPPPAAGSTQPQTQGPEHFLRAAASGNRLEIESSKVLSGGTTSPEMNAFAQHMVRDHTQAQEELQQLARRKNLTLSEEMLPEHQRQLEDLRKAEWGEAFNRSYRDLQIAAHEEAVRLYEAAAGSGNDRDVRAFAEKMLPKLREHLEMARKLPKTISPGASRN